MAGRFLARLGAGGSENAHAISPKLPWDTGSVNPQTSHLPAPCSQSSANTALARSGPGSGVQVRTGRRGHGGSKSPEPQSPQNPNVYLPGKLSLTQLPG